MKAPIAFVIACAFLAAPLFAAKVPTVTISQAVTVGSTQIPAGDYKVTYAGSGAAVKVTLAKSGAAPIVLDARLDAGQKGSGGVLIGTENGARILQEIDLSSGALIFASAPAADK